MLYANYYPIALIKIFIATENGHEKAEKALEYSILSSSSEEVSITWMKDQFGETFSGWNKSRNNSLVNSGIGWKTNFSCYRWAIPELCEFSGKAIYLDVDQIVLKDIAQMWNLEMSDKAVLSIRPEKTDVMLIDCSKFAGDWWPRISEMKPSGKSQKHYRCMVQNRGLIGDLDGIYNCLDGKGLSENTRLLHYTNMNTQPWHPSPESMVYKPHKHHFLDVLWWGFYYKALEYESATKRTLGNIAK